MVIPWLEECNRFGELLLRRFGFDNLAVDGQPAAAGADMVILDRDYFTVPVDDILKVRPLMTMVGGRIQVLQGSLAEEFGVPAVGPEYGFRDEDVAHIGQPLSQ